MLISYKRGQGSVILRVKVLDSTVSTGAGKTGLTSSSTGLKIATTADNEAAPTTYTVAGSTIESITTLGTYAAPTATKCRFKEVHADHPGVYELQIADARFAVASAKSLLISLSGVTGMAECDVVIPLRDLDPYDAVRAGLTALPNAVANANGGLPILSVSGTTLGYTITTLTTYTGNTPQTGDNYARIGAAGAGLTALGDARIANLDVAVSTRLASSSYVSPPSAATISTTVWTQALPGAFAAGSAGYIVGNFSGGSGSADWTADERKQFRQALGITGAVLATTGAGVIDTIADNTNPNTTLIRALWPALVDGKLALIKGDSYSAADQHALIWIERDTDPAWPDLAGATITFTISSPDLTIPLSVSGTVVSNTAPRKVQVELTAVQTGTLLPGSNFSYSVLATLASGRLVTLVRDTALVTSR